MVIDLVRFLPTFLEESFEGLDAMETCLLHLDVSAANPEAIHTIFRVVHSMKGGSATFGFSAIATFIHVIETLLDEIRDGHRQVTQETVDLLLAAVDGLRDVFRAVRQGSTIDLQRLVQLQAHFERLVPGAHSPDNSQDHAIALQNHTSSGYPKLVGWHIWFRPLPHMLQTGNDPLRLFRALRDMGEPTVRVETSQVPSFTDVQPETCYLAWEIILRGTVSRQEVLETFAWVEDDCELRLTPLFEDRITSAPEAVQRLSGLATSNTSETDTAPASHAQVLTDRRQPSGLTDTTSLRVSIEKIDALVNAVGELVITQAMLSQVGEHFTMQRLEQLRDGLDQLERHTRVLQDSVMRIRMVPISFALRHLPRLVHDISRALGKKVRLDISGEQTELDKTVMEKMGHPLVHLVRNALDHGIELPHVRQAAGKPETGRLRLHVAQQRSTIIIEISDDGAGLDQSCILQRARERGLIRDHKPITEEQVHALIFHPGFSTAATVSDVSGRGVGMDIVRRNIRALGGSIDVRSQTGQGTTFTMTLPLTVAMLDGQLLRVGDATYIVPLTAIVESVQIDPQRLSLVAGEREVYRHHNEYVPLMRLDDLCRRTATRGDLTDALVVVVEADGRRTGLVVDELLGQQQVVLKSLETNFKRLPGVAGATILGNGSVSLILDVADLLARALPTRRPAPPGLH